MHGRLMFVKHKGRVHVEVIDDASGLVSCGTLSAQGWPYGEMVDGEVMISLRPVMECQHGGTYEEPEPWFQWMHHERITEP